MSNSPPRPAWDGNAKQIESLRAALSRAERERDEAHHLLRSLRLAIRAVLSEGTGEHDAYVEPLGGGWKGYQARCWDCDWRGPERLRGAEEIGTDEGRAHKAAARKDAAAHRSEAVPLSVAQDLAEARAENERLRELYENAVGNRERFGWTINHLLECEEALRTTQQELAKAEPVLVAADRLRDAYDAMLEGRDIGRLPEWESAALSEGTGEQK